MRTEQGDVYFTECKIPETAAKMTCKDRYVLAEGEVTGHAHAVYDLSTCDVFIDCDGEIYVETKEPTIVKHEEHKPVVLEKGKTFKVSIVKEYDPFAEEIRRVRD